ncbi:MAG: SDR family NAD(P)-dependent oxidoreductase [Bacteroidales bacterium]
MKNVKLNPLERNCDIAVIGLGCYYPGAKSPLELWENILARRQQFREMPDVRLPNSEYYDPDPSVLNKTYQNKAAVIEGYEFDWMGKRIPKQTYESTDIVHWLALDTALQAIADTGFTKDTILKEKTGVILGNTLTGEFTRSNQMLLRWPYVRRALKASAAQKGLSHVLGELEGTMEAYYKSVFAPVTEDTLAGGLANTVAGRICNYLDLHGGGYIVDGACSSSMLAVITAANYLESGQMDLVIAGGVDISLDTFELVGFSKTRALTPDEMRVYDKGGKGFLPGEGCGMVVLKRLEDAVKDNNQIYAIVKGWGISSDGKGGITAPSAAGQSRALIRAHEKAGLNSKSLDFIEGHGTGTTVGDKVELEGITIALNHKDKVPPRSCGVTSLKSIVGHTKAAAGIGAFIKTVMAVNRRVLPPTAGLKDLNDIFEEKAQSVYPVIHGQVRDSGSTLIAGVSAMGFGGINSHVVMQSGDSPNPKLQPSLPESKLMVSNQTHELYLFAAGSRDALIEELKQFQQKASGMSYAEMADLAFQHNLLTNSDKPLRAAIVAHTPFELDRKIIFLIEQVGKWNETHRVSFENNSIVLGLRKGNPVIGALFPGQGSQKLNMTNKLTKRYDWLQEMVKHAADLFNSCGSDQVISSVFRPLDRAADKQEVASWMNQLKQTQIAQPAITLASLVWYKYIERLGIKIDYASGHSLGELMAFYAAGLLSEETLLRFAAFRGKSMAEFGSGTMASLSCNKEQVEKYLKEVSGYVTIANINAPEQIVISGEADSVRLVVALAAKDQVQAIELPVSAAFHSKLVAEVAEEIAKYDQLKAAAPGMNSVKLVSSVSGREIDEAPDLNAYFATQAVHQVDFISVIKHLESQCDMLIEIGPGKVLSGLVSNISDKIRAFPVELNSLDDFSWNIMLANAFVLGCNLNADEIYKGRLIREFTPANKKKFLVNPLERPFPEEPLMTENDLSSGIGALLGFGNDDPAFSDYLKLRSDFIRQMVDADFKFFSKSKTELSGQAAKTSIPAQVSAAPKAVPPQSQASSGIKDVLYKKIESMTGFSADGFRDDMKLLDDFNLDSIKSGALLAGLVKSLNATGKINTSELSNASLGEIVSRLNTLVPEQQHAAGTPVAASSDKPGKNVAEVINSILAERTGFPKESIQPDFKLLDDLNLDSIKAGSFVAEISKQFGIQGKLGASKVANAKVEDVIRMVGELVSESSVPEGSSDEKANADNWVNAYSVKLMESPVAVAKQTVQEYWKNKSMVIVHHADDEKAASNMVRVLKSRISKVISVKSNDLHMLHSLENTCLLVMLPDVIINGKNTEKIVTLLADVAGNLSEVSLLGFVQQHDGCFSRYALMPAESKAAYSAVGFAASLHHERPDMRIRVVEVSRKLPADLIPDIFMNEFTTNESFMAAGYDADQVRRRMQYEPAVTGKTLKEEPGFIDETDVVVATGGAKGITAECVFSFAQKYKCKIALIGSSPENEEVRTTLSRYGSADLTAQYFVCDIGKDGQVKETIANIQKSLGHVTAIIHGAGRNVPRRAENVTAGDAMDEIAPKLAGAINLLNALGDNRLKYVVALTSIIGVTGMPGNSWYAFSNEALDLLLRRFGQSNKCRTRTLAYSVWDEVGMGARMGSNKVLAGMGIGSIAPSLGVEQFLHWFEHENSDQQVVISSRMGGLDTWYLLQPELPEARRYIADIRHMEPGRELKVRVKLNRKDDLYIDDHNYNGSLLFPTVFGLEAMAQAACMLAGAGKVNHLVFENVSLIRPIVVPETGDMEVEITARVMEGSVNTGEPVRIFTGISTEYAETGFNSFSAEIIIGTKSEAIQRTIDLPEVPLKISPESDLYTWLLFQGPRFRNISKVYDLNKESVTFTAGAVQKDPAEVCFSETCRSPLLLGSPLFRDILLQSVQLFLTGKKYLPVGIKRWEIYDVGRQFNGGTIKSDLNELSETEGICNVEFVSDGYLAERIEGYTVKALEPTPDYPEPERIAALENVYREALDHELGKYRNLMGKKVHYGLFKHDGEFNRMDASERHLLEDNLLRELLAEMNVSQDGKDHQIQRSANGKPAIGNSDLKISISHSRSVLLMTTGEHEQGCDIEFVESRPVREWNELLEGRYGSLLEQLQRTDKDINVSATRLWCLKEAMIKSLGVIPVNISIEKVLDRGVVFRVRTNEQPDCMVLTFPVHALPNNTAIIANLIELRSVTTVADPAETEESGKSLVYDEKLGKFCYGFYTTFKDCKRFFGKTHFTNYPGWMGTLRELVLAPISQQLLSDLGSGLYGMVTNESDIQIFNEADTLNEITGNLWITNKSDFDNSFIDLNFEYLKKDPGTGSLIRLANCNLSTTWVKIEGRGIVKKSPIPAYFMDFLEKYKGKSVSLKGQEKLSHYPGMKDLGVLKYENPSKIRPSILLSERVFDTGMHNGNAVGNLYYSNYYDWQSNLMEQYLYQLAPEIFISSGRSGEFISIESSVKHLQEAMPFEDILTRFYIDRIYEHGVRFHFEYFSVNNDEKRKLAYGFNTVIWCRRKDEKAVPVAQHLPEKLTEAIRNLVMV